MEEAKKNKEWDVKTTILLGVSLVYSAMFFIQQPVKKERNIAQEALKKLEYHYDSLHQVNQVLDCQMEELENKMGQLMQLVNMDQQRISDLKQRKIENMEYMDQLTYHELFRFFTELDSLQTYNQR